MSATTSLKFSTSTPEALKRFVITTVGLTLLTKTIFMTEISVRLQVYLNSTLVPRISERTVSDKEGVEFSLINWWTRCFKGIWRVRVLWDVISFRNIVTNGYDWRNFYMIFGFTFFCVKTFITVLVNMEKFSNYNSPNRNLQFFMSYT